MGASRHSEKSAYEALSPKHRKVLDLYLSNGFVAWKAYQDAGYGGDNPKYDVMCTNGARLLRNAQFQAALSERIAELAMPESEVLHRLAEHARGDVGDFFDITESGHPVINLNKSPEKTRLIRKIKVKETTFTNQDGDTETTITTEFELYSPQKALELLGKHHGTFSPGPDGSEEKPFVVKVVKGELANEL